MSATERLQRGARRLGSVVPPDTTAGYLIRLSRPRFWLYLAGPVIVGAVYGAPSIRELFSPLSVALFCYFLVPANVLLYGVNDVFDADIDAENPKKGNREVQYRDSRIVVAAVVLSGVLALGFVPAFVFTPALASTPSITGALAALVGFLVLAVAYSVPPARLKTTPPLDSVSNGLYILPGVLTYTALAGELPPLAAVLGGWLWAMGMHTFSAIPDIEPDRAAGIHTTATTLGESRAYAYCGACWLVAAGVFAFVHPAFGALLLAYPILVFAIARSSVAVSRAYWWYPAVNTLVGMVMSLGGIWLLLDG